MRQHAARWWSSTGCALLPTGDAFDYVKAPGYCARAVADRFPKAALINYPRYWRVAVLVVPGTANTWDLETAGGMVCEGAGEHLNVPAPDRTAMEGEDPYWLRPPGDQPWFPPANELAALLHRLEEDVMRAQQPANEHRT
ncbi:hypothetical protein [Actinomadura sp. SCN-SB]|uniref:hypothetical protein n=1 Tax=Actinomadura sp. SCN-SB TaxID=3373092 RepID=UPI0037502C10